MEKADGLRHGCGGGSKKAKKAYDGMTHGMCGSSAHKGKSKPKKKGR